MTNVLTVPALRSVKQVQRDGEIIANAYKVRYGLSKKANDSLECRAIHASQNTPMNGAFHAPLTIYGVRVAGEVLELQTKFFSQQKGGGVRGGVSCFSGASRRRLFKTLAAINFSLYGDFYFLTLTYPGEFPLDGLVVKRDLDNFRRSWTDRYGAPVAAWKLEFQARGAPHLHLAIAAIKGMSVEVARHEISRLWFQVVGSEDPRHLRAGVNLQMLRDHPAAYFAGYVGFSKGSKEYQHSVPEGFENVGRFWGLWNLAPDWNAQLVDRADWVELRRLTRKWCRSKRLYSGRCGREQSEWLHVRGSSALLLLTKLSRALSRPVIFT